METGDFPINGAYSEEQLSSWATRCCGLEEEPLFVCIVRIKRKDCYFLLTSLRLTVVTCGNKAKVLVDVPLEGIDACRVVRGKVVALAVPNELHEIEALTAKSAQQIEGNLLRLIDSPEVRAVRDDRRLTQAEMNYKDREAERARNRDLTGEGHTEFGPQLLTFKCKDGDVQGNLVLYERAVVRRSEIRSIDKLVSAEVVSQGTFLVNYRTTVARSLAAAALIPGPTAIFGLASQKKVVQDSRQSYLAIAHPKWQWTLPISVDDVAQAKAIALRINLLAQALDDAEAGQAESSLVQPVDTLQPRLSQLKELVSKGLLTDEEAARKRADILKEL